MAPQQGGGVAEISEGVTVGGGAGGECGVATDTMVVTGECLLFLIFFFPVFFLDPCSFFVGAKY